MEKKGKKKIEKGFEINAQFKNEEIDLDTMANFSMKDIKSRKAIKLLNKSEVGSNFVYHQRDFLLTIRQQSEF